MATEEITEVQIKIFSDFFNFSMSGLQGQKKKSPKNETINNASDNMR